MNRSSIAVIVVLGLVAALLGACDQGGSGSATTGGKSSAKAGNSAASGLTFSATLSYRKAPNRGRTSNETVKLFENLSIYDSYHEWPENLEVELKYDDGEQGFTGSVKNNSPNRLPSGFVMQNVKIEITVSNGKQFSWSSEKKDIQCGNSEQVTIPAPLGK